MEKLKNKVINNKWIFILLVLPIVTGTVSGISSGIMTLYYAASDFSIMAWTNRFSSDIETSDFEVVDALPMYREFPIIPNFGAINSHVLPPYGYAPRETWRENTNATAFFDVVFSYPYHILYNYESVIDDYVRILKENNFTHLTTRGNRAFTYLIFNNSYSKYLVALGFSRYPSRNDIDPSVGWIPFSVYVLEADRLT